MLARYLPDIWRGGPTYRKIKLNFDQSFGEPASTAIAASLPIDAAALGVGSTLGLVLMLSDAASGTLREALDTTAHLIVGPFVVLLLLFFSVLFFARPRLLIPPHLRANRGFIPELVSAVLRRIQGRTSNRRRGRS